MTSDEPQDQGDVGRLLVQVVQLLEQLVSKQEESNNAVSAIEEGVGQLNGQLAEVQKRLSQLEQIEPFNVTLRGQISESLLQTLGVAGRPAITPPAKSEGDD